MSESETPNGQKPAKKQPILTLSRLVLRPIESADAGAINALLADRVIAANTRDIPFPYSLELAQEWIEPQRQSWEHGKAAVFAICLNGALIGVIGLEIESHDERAELGYWMGKAWWGQGYCTEAAVAVIEFAFESLKLRRVYAYHMEHNQASGRVMEKAGMKHEGSLKQHTKKWGKFEDVAVWGVVNTRS